jgi:hypothetical protein
VFFSRTYIINEDEFATTKNKSAEPEKGIQMARSAGSNLIHTNQANWNEVLTFECPICKNNTFDEVWGGATAVHHISGLDAQNGPIIEERLAHIEDAVFLGFYCCKCNYQLKNADGSNVRCDRELATYLENQAGNNLKAEGYRRSLLKEGPRQICAYCEQPCNHHVRGGWENYQGAIQ